PAPEDELARRRGRGRWVTMLAVAATAAAALALVWWRTATPRGELDDGPDVLRGSASGAIEARGPRGPVTADAAFAWQPIASPAIDGYVVHVLTIDGRPVWTSPRVAAPPVALPPAARAPGRYVWYVEAVRGERVVAASRNTDFAIAP
ncbi:MAG: hypothetical protein K8W52_20945, partial [Deltaproteobacteria bacterium]|nr:hypothetical protein [Deltaproteobacteria bacterium]